jgi:GntR family transcriptional repressor for pyruvate dehydrogenase complex
MSTNSSQAYLAGVEVRPDLSQHLSQQILEMILSGNLQAGDRLPSTKELAERFSVATPTIREALRRLQGTGVIDIRHGSGIYVRRAGQGLIITNPYHGALNADSAMQLLDARLAIEPYLAGKAADQSTDEDIVSLERLLDEAKLLLIGQDAKLHPTNMQFHAEIARISRNSILSAFFESLVELYSREQLGILAIFNARTRDHEEHVRIFEAIRSHDPSLAADRMKEHLLGVRGVVEERLIDSSV